MSEAVNQLDAFVGVGAVIRGAERPLNAARFERPLARVRDTLRFLRRALAGERIDEAYETFGVRGFSLARPPAMPPTLWVTALRERMLALAGGTAHRVLSRTPEHLYGVRPFG